MPQSLKWKRLVRSLSTWQMLKLGIELWRPEYSTTKEAIEKLKQKDYVKRIADEEKRDFPVWHKVVFQDRELYLTNSLKLAADTPFVRHYSQEREQKDSIHEPPIVVGVVGIAHVEGIVQNWETVQPEDVEKLLNIPSKSKIEQFAGILLRGSLQICSVITFGYMTGYVVGFAGYSLC